MQNGDQAPRAQPEIPAPPGGQAPIGAQIQPGHAPEGPQIDAPANQIPPQGQPQVAVQPQANQVHGPGQIPQMAGQPQVAMYLPVAHNIVQAAQGQGPGQIIVQQEPEVLEILPELAVVGQKQVISKSQQDMIRKAPYLGMDLNSRSRERAQNALRIAAIRVECGEQNFVKK